MALTDPGHLTTQDPDLGHPRLGMTGPPEAPDPDA